MARQTRSTKTPAKTPAFSVASLNASMLRTLRANIPALAAHAVARTGGDLGITDLTSPAESAGLSPKAVAVVAAIKKGEFGCRTPGVADLMAIVLDEPRIREAVAATPNEVGGNGYPCKTPTDVPLALGHLVVLTVNRGELAAGDLVLISSVDTSDDSGCGYDANGVCKTEWVYSRKDELRLPTPAEAERFLERLTLNAPSAAAAVMALIGRD